MLPSGFFGTRADILMDVAIILFVALPFVMSAAIRLVRRGEHIKHRNLQAVTLALIATSLLLFEADIRLSGGTQALLAQSGLAPNVAGGFLLFHVLIAVGTFVSWLSLARLSWKRFHASLPGGFTAQHTIWGKLTFVGVCLTSATGCGVYFILFAS